MKIRLKNGLLDLTERVLVMGILNITPDSFSDGGQLATPDKIIAHIRTMITGGADIIDIGGESSRPFSEPVPAEEELARVLPVIEAIRAISSVPVSIDTTKAVVARQALAAGADIINDISALRFDPKMIEVACATGAPVILMHMQGTPKTMQENPVYEDVIAEITAFFAERLRWAEARGLPRDRIILDPGIGFGKTVAHNCTILKNLTRFKALGRPLLVGHSRKAFIGKILDLPVTERDVATATVSALCAANGADILRVHDVGQTVQAVRLAQAILDEAAGQRPCPA